ncbi:hypothetical protein F5050DRAFT_1897552 [Lentinula boryana]|uniref:Uncharacterized protein n=1 Tax=Lentinula boryana TaxID=40481 RepID=A0ABQ8Q358_9AGAR|nr:hypothetical protein F5050DRAFT_1897552 [Lentinula boryana]
MYDRKKMLNISTMSPGRNFFFYKPAFEPPSVQANDADMDDSSYTKDMIIDLGEADSLLDVEGDLTLRKTEADAAREQPGKTHRAMRRTFVDNDVDSRTYTWHPTAGKVYKQASAAHARWRALFDKAHDDDKSSEYGPFSSRLDWEFAQSSIKEKVPQKSINRSLKIPQFKEKLGLSFSNARSMLQSGQYPLEAIKGLWGDPAFVDDLVYKPAKMFGGAKQMEEE